MCQQVRLIARVEHPKGEFGIYLVSDGANKPLSFENSRFRLCPFGGDG